MLYVKERIAHILEKCNRGLGGLKSLSAREDIFIFLIIVLVGFGGFGLGRLSKISEEKHSVRIDTGSALSGISGNTGDTPIKAPENRQFVASVSGTKYHLPWCASASSIK